METCEIGQKILAKDVQASQIINIVIRKTQVLYIVNDLSQTAGDGLGAAAWIGAVEHIKHNRIVIAVQKITLHHGQLI